MILMKYLEKNTTMPDPITIYKTIEDIRKNNRDEDKIIRDLTFLLDPKKDPDKPVKTINAFINNYVQYESIRDKDKSLSIKEYIDKIRPYLSDIINDHKTQGEWKVQSTMAINFFSSKDSEETRTMHTK